jgi:peptidoglycan/xylan/chitin deacetylase (PgdA/CDA1 family)
MRLLYRRKVLILAYHGFTDRTAHGGIENNQGKHLNADLFRSHVEYLKNHYRVISLDRLIEYYTSGARIPDRTAVVTIDDGYESTYLVAYPILKEIGVPATVFLTAGFVENKEWLWSDRVEYALTATRARLLQCRIGDDAVVYDVHDGRAKLACARDIRSRLKSVPQESRAAVVEDMERDLGRRLPGSEETPAIYRPLEWRQVVEMVESGVISIGSHTVSHVILTRCTPENARKELLLSKEIIERRTGVPCRLFCYPNGQVGCFDARTRQLLLESGYTCGITTVFGVNDERSDVFELKRLYFDDRGEMIRFIMTLAGVVGVLDRVKRWMRASGRARAVNEDAR